MLRKQMKRSIKKVDTLLYAMGQGISAHKFKVLVLMLVLIFGMISQVPKITLDTSTEGFLHEEDPVRVAYDKFQHQFGHDEKIVIAIKTDGIFKLENLEKLKKLHQELQAEVPYLNDITSLINARQTTGDADSLLVEDLFETWPKTESQMAAKKAYAMHNPMYSNLLLNSDGTFNVIVLEANTYTSLDASGHTVDEATPDFDAGFGDDVSSDEEKAFISDGEIAQMVHKVREITKEYKADNFQIEIAGSPSVTETLKRSLQKDIKKFNGLIILTIIITLSLLFRRVSGVVFPLLAVVLSVLSTVGLIAFFGTPIKIPTQILPSFSLAVGVGTSIHIMAIFFHHFDKYGDKREAIAYTLGHSGLAIIMTSLTTAAGIGSFFL
ncbi:MAG TPA: RND transporter, partial [Helicobacteraceae bacterium]|nr:RND transporter [Helicobacteraceae bacterium]